MDVRSSSAFSLFFLKIIIWCEDNFKYPTTLVYNIKSRDRFLCVHMQCLMGTGEKSLGGECTGLCLPSIYLTIQAAWFALQLWTQCAWNAQLLTFCWFIILQDSSDFLCFCTGILCRMPGSLQPHFSSHWENQEVGLIKILSSSKL